MSKRKIILLLVAGFVAIGTMAAVRALMSPAEKPQAEQAKTTEVLAAAHDLPTGTILKEMDMKWVPWAADADTAQLYIKGKDDMSAVAGGVLRDSLRSDEPLMRGRIVQAHDHGFLAAVLEPGKRAMTVTLTPSAEVAGFIFPGDHVDVILTNSFTRKNGSDTEQRRVSETLLTDVRVLALDQKSDDQSTDPKVAQLATLEVTPKQAEKLALAADMVGQGASSHGSINLVLRSLASTDAGTPASGTSALNKMSQSWGSTWDSDISAAYPNDSLVERVHIMRGKDTTDSDFQRHQ